MYQGKHELFNPEGHEETRNQSISYRGGAIYTAFVELEDIINKAEFAQQYLGKSSEDFNKKLDGCPVGGSQTEFSAKEAKKIAESFRDIAKRLTALAEEIDAVATVD
ncbi:MAG: DUF5053 domain-containing protein [Candidatus Cryptobacteroides sp.]